MSRYRKVLTRIWKDEKFRPLEPDPRMLFLYHLTSDQSTPFLLYVEGAGSIGDALSMTSRRLRDAMQTLSSVGLSRYSTAGDDYVFLPKALLIEENAPNGPNAVTAWLKLFRDMPATPFRRACVEHWRSLMLSVPHARAFVDGIADDVSTPSDMTPERRLDSGAVAVTGAVTGDSRSIVGQPPDVSSLNGFHAEAKELLAFLNEKTGRSYRPVPANLKLIEARLKSGATVQECRGVIARKVREWGTDPKMAEYLRPETLFNATKFESYRGMAQQEATS